MSTDVRTALSPLLDAVASGVGPASGAIAAGTAASAAALICRAARRAPGWEEAGGVTAQAAELQRRALALASETAEVHARAVALLAEAEATGQRGSGGLGPALAAAADAPLRLAVISADIATLAAHTAPHVSAHDRPDVAAAADLAAGAARTGATLVGVNLTVGEQDERRAAAEEAATRAARSAREANG